MTPRVAYAVTIATCLLAAAVGLLLAGTTDDRTPDAAYLDYAKGFAPYTARIHSVPGDDPWEATATAVADRWLLTAAHVVGDSATAVARLGGKDYAIEGIVRHPDYKLGVTGVCDLALLRTSEPLGLGYYPPLSDGEERPGDICSIVGYGCHGLMSAGHTRYDGRLRAGTNLIERFDDATRNIECTASPGGTALEICVAPGDSGGGLFCRGRLAGVHSLTYAHRSVRDGGPPKSRTGEVSVHTRVSEHREWILGLIQP